MTSPTPNPVEALNQSDRFLTDPVHESSENELSEERVTENVMQFLLGHISEEIDQPIELIYRYCGRPTLFAPPNIRLYRSLCPTVSDRPDKIHTIEWGIAVQRRTVSGIAGDIAVRKQYALARSEFDRLARGETTQVPMYTTMFLEGFGIHSKAAYEEQQAELTVIANTLEDIAAVIGTDYQL